MAEAFINVAKAVTATVDGSTEVVYTCPAATKAIVIHCQVANVDGTNAADLSIDLYDSSTTTAAGVVSTLSVPADSAVNPIGGKLVLEASDELRVWANDASDLELTVGILEIS